MNVAFFLIPKSDLVYIKIDSTIRQALEKMEYHRYSAVPLVDEEGRYAGTLTEGDLLWKLKNTPSLDFSNTHEVRLHDVPLHRSNEPVKIDAEIQDLLTRAMGQNFVPIIDDAGTFIGIVRRREIIEYCAKDLLTKSVSE